MQPAAYSMYGINKEKKAQPVVDPKSIGFDPEDALRTHMQSAAEGRDQTIGHYEPSHQIFNAKRVNGLEAMLPRMAGQPRQQASIALARDSDREGRLKRDVGAIGRSGNAAFFVPQSVVDAQEQDRKRRKSERQQVQAERQVPSVADLDAQFRREGKGYSASAISARVGIMSMKCPGKSLKLLASTTPGQYTINGVFMPPSKLKFL